MKLYSILLNILFFSLVSLHANTLPVIDVIGNKEVNEDSSLDVVFKISDAETSSDDLEVEITSSDQSILPDSSISTTLKGSSRTMSLVPSLNQNGPTTISVKVTDKDKGVTTETFQLNVKPVNDPPTISLISPQVTDEDISTDLIGFMVEDVDDKGEGLSVSSLSSNTTLVPDANVIIGGIGNSRNIQINPAENKHGETTITLTVDDGQLNNTTQFSLKVNSVNDPPEITKINSQSTDEDVPTPDISFTISDVEDKEFEVSAESSNKALINNSGGINFGGSGANRTISLSPVSNANGSSKITVTVTDKGGASSFTDFTIDVAPINDSPTISLIEDQIFYMGGAPAVSVPITVNDVDGDSLTVSGSSDHSEWLPSDKITDETKIGNLRTIKLEPSVSVLGIQQVTIMVTDPFGASVTEVFNLESLPNINFTPVVDLNVTNNNFLDSLGIVKPFIFSVSDPGDELTVKFEQLNGKEWGNLIFTNDLESFTSVNNQDVNSYLNGISFEMIQ